MDTADHLANLANELRACVPQDLAQMAPNIGGRPLTPMERHMADMAQRGAQMACLGARMARAARHVAGFTNTNAAPKGGFNAH